MIVTTGFPPGPPEVSADAGSTSRAAIPDRRSSRITFRNPEGFLPDCFFICKCMDIYNIKLSPWSAGIFSPVSPFVRRTGKNGMRDVMVQGIRDPARSLQMCKDPAQRSLRPLPRQTQRLTVRDYRGGQEQSMYRRG